MESNELRIALFSGNYNYVRDGANQALNRLVGYLLRQGAQVRVYAPTVKKPAFEPTGTLVSVPSLPFPMRSEYRFALGLSGKGIVLLLLSLLVTTQTLATGRTTILQGMVHLVIFGVYLFTTVVP